MTAEPAARVRRVLGRAAGATVRAVGKLSDRRFSRTPAGRARKAHERGDSVFQYRAQMDDLGQGELLSSIEAEGWVLEDTQLTTETSTTTDSAGNSHAETTTHAVYLFRRKGTEGSPPRS